MPTVQVHVPKMPEGYEKEGEYRAPKAGEHCVNCDGTIWVCTCDQDMPWLVVRPAWVWPAALIPPWVAMDRGGEWFAHEDEPHVSDDGWYSTGKRIIHAPYKIFPLLHFTPPPCTDWRQSKRRNPNA